MQYCQRNTLGFVVSCPNTQSRWSSPWNVEGKTAQQNYTRNKSQKNVVFQNTIIYPNNRRKDKFIKWFMIFQSTGSHPASTYPCLINHSWRTGNFKGTYTQDSCKIKHTLYITEDNQLIEWIIRENIHELTRIAHKFHILLSHFFNFSTGSVGGELCLST